MKEKLEIQVGAGGYSLKVSGLQPVAQIAQYLADAIGIVGEPLGMVRDSLANYRVHRAEAAAAAMIRAKEIAALEGRSINNVSPKYLSPWLEGASSEDLNDDNILELWAQILAASSGKFDPMLGAFTDILKKIGPEEAHIISRLVPLRYMTGIQGAPNDGAMRFAGQDECAKNNLQIAEQVSDHFASNSTQGTKGIRKCFGVINRRLDGALYSIFVNHGSSGFGFGGNKASLEILDYAGVTTRNSYTKNNGVSTVNLTWMEPTAVGLKLFELLNKERLLLPEGGSMGNYMEQYFPDRFAELQQFRS